MNLPHNDTAEQALLGLLLLDNAGLKVIDGVVTADDFYSLLYRQTFQVIGQMIDQGLQANPVSICAKLPPLKEADHFVKLVESVTYATDLPTMAATVADYAHRRRIIVAAQELATAAQGSNESSLDAAQRHLAGLYAASGALITQSPTEQAQNAFKLATGGASMVPTGFRAWDDPLGGLFPGSRYMIAGQGGAGKSALAINIAWNWAKSGKKVRWLSYEEKPEALWWRIMARESLMPYIGFRNGLSPYQQSKVIENASGVGEYDFQAFYGISTPAKMAQVCGICDLIVLDGMTTAPAPGGESMVDNAGIVTRYCAALAEKTGAVVIILAHINSDAVKNGATMAGIYGGQAATFDPEAIVEIRRADPTDKSKGPKEIKLNIIKARYGEAGGEPTSLMFNGNNMVFYDKPGTV